MTLSTLFVVCSSNSFLDFFLLDSWKEMHILLHEPGSEIVTSEFSFVVLPCSYKWLIPNCTLKIYGKIQIIEEWTTNKNIFILSIIVLVFHWWQEANICSYWWLKSYSKEKSYFFSEYWQKKKSWVAILNWNDIFLVIILL